MGKDKHKVRKSISRKINKAILHFNMIEPNDRVLIAVSGGKDSMTLLQDLARRQKNYFIPYTLEAIHIEADFMTCYDTSALRKQVEDLGITFHSVNAPIIERLKPGRTMNCYWCSMQRRVELLKFAEENKFNSIALGHHMDDIIETLFMNMFSGKIATMPPKLAYNKRPISLIRPLCYIEEDEVLDFLDEIGYSKLSFTCEYGKNSGRHDMRERIDTFIKSNSTTKRKIFESMSNVDHGYLPQNEK